MNAANTVLVVDDDVLVPVLCWRPMGYADEEVADEATLGDAPARDKASTVRYLLGASALRDGGAGVLGGRPQIRGSTIGTDLGFRILRCRQSQSALPQRG